MLLASQYSIGSGVLDAQRPLCPEPGVAAEDVFVVDQSLGDGPRPGDGGEVLLAGVVVVVVSLLHDLEVNARD